jgi:hypothetical protein
MHVKIAFVGDSFCADITRKFCYPYIVAQELGAEIISGGLSGSHYYQSYYELVGPPEGTRHKMDIDEADYIILCITEPFRLPNKWGFGLTESVVLDYMSNMSKSQRAEDNGNNKWLSELPMSSRKIAAIMEDAEKYFFNIMNRDFHMAAQKGLLMQTDEKLLSQVQQKKCIWFPCFPSSMQGFVPKSGPMADTPLFDLCIKENPEYWLAKDPTRRMANHFSDVDNENMAKVILDTFSNHTWSGPDRFNPSVIEMGNYFG